MRVISIFQASIVTALVLAAGQASQTSAYADSAMCSTLKRQLAVANGGGSQKNSRAAQQQALQLQQMRAKASKEGCGGFLFSRGDPALCKRYSQTIDGMSARLAKLQNASVQSGQSRQQILASMNANGCNEKQASAGRRADAAPERKTLLEVLFGSRDEQDTPAAGVKVKQRPQPEVRDAPRKNSSPVPETLAATYEGTEPQGGYVVKKGYRTLCVRTCDGYYFPISFSTKPQFFGRDQNACSAMCPGADAKLYYHAVPEQESDAMISVADKKPYTELPTAFLYRTSGLNSVPGCTCHAAQSETPGPTSQQTPAESAPVAALSAPKETAGDALTIEPAQTNPDVTVTAAMPAPAPSAGNVPENVRVVGPAFFPQETHPTDLKAIRPPEKEVKMSKASILTPENIVKTIASDIAKRIQ
jgi:hypothetical protein